MPPSSASSRRRASPGVGGLGQRRRGARARLPRHLPRGRVLAPGRQHPADRSPSRSTPARDRRATLVRGIATGYEIQVDLVRAICLHEHKIDHVAHLGPSAAAGIGTLLGLRTETIFQAIGQALHTTTATRQSRKGEISTLEGATPRRSPGRWPSRPSTGRCAARPPRPRSTRARTASSPGCSTARRPRTRCRCPSPARPSARSSTRYTKEHSAEYQAQALDRPGPQAAPRAPGPRPTRANVESIVLHTSHHTHYVIGSGANDPQKYDPTASPRDPRPLDPVHLRRRAAGRRLAPRRLLRARARAPRPDTVALWQKVTTAEDPEWTRRYHSTDPAEKAFGGRVVITLTDGDVDRRRDRRRRRAPARRPAVRPRAVRRASSAPSPSGVLDRGRDRARSSTLAAAPARADGRTSSAGLTVAAPPRPARVRPRRPPKGLF